MYVCIKPEDTSRREELRDNLHLPIQNRRNQEGILKNGFQRKVGKHTVIWSVLLTLSVLFKHQLSLFRLILVLSTPPILSSFTCKQTQITWLSTDDIRLQDGLNSIFKMIQLKVHVYTLAYD